MKEQEDDMFVFECEAVIVKCDTVLKATEYLVRHSCG